MELETVLINYNYEPTWLKQYPQLQPITIYDRSDDGKDHNLTQYGRVIRTTNIGNVDYDKLGHLIEHYDTLPERFLWGKTNMFKYITPEEFDEALTKPGFVPLLTQNHKTYSDNVGPICYYQGGMYYERNNSWYLTPHPAAFADFAQYAAYLNQPNPPYLPFPPGGNFILTRERVHRYSRDLYEKMRDSLGYTMLPGEAFMLERMYYTLWK